MKVVWGSVFFLVIGLSGCLTFSESRDEDQFQLLERTLTIPLNQLMDGARNANPEDNFSLYLVYRFGLKGVTRSAKTANEFLNFANQPISFGIVGDKFSGGIKQRPNFKLSLRNTTQVKKCAFFLSQRKGIAFYQNECGSVEYYLSLKVLWDREMGEK